MARVKRAQIRKTRIKNLRKRTKGYHGGRSRLRQAKAALMKAEANAYVGRKQRKRHFRRLWITRISAAVRPHGINYSQFIHGLNQAGINLNRKMLAELAVTEPATFETIVGQAKAALPE